MIPAVSILHVMRDPQLFGTVFADPSWRAWRLCAAVIFGLTDGLTPGEHALITRCLGARTLPTQQVREAWLVCGRRAGKSFFVALIAVYLSCFARIGWPGASAACSWSWPPIDVKPAWSCDT